MTGLRGGIRSRMMSDSFRVGVLAALMGLGWFDDTTYDNPPGNRPHRPMRYIARPPEWQDIVELNSFSISPEEFHDEPTAMGREPGERDRMYVDFFAEDDIVGRQFAHDVEAVIIGQFPQYGRLGPVFDLYDLRSSTPEAFTRVEVEDVRVERATGFPKAWQRHWFVISCFLVDDYLDDIRTYVGEPWSAEMQAALDMAMAAQ